MAAEAIGNLYAVLGIDTGRFDAGVDKAKGKLNDFGKTNFSKGVKAGLDEVDGALKGLAGNAGALGGILSGLGIGGVAAAAAIAVAFNGARDAMAFGDDIADTANKLKVTTDYLQEMRFAAHGLGGDFQDADDAIEAFTKNFGLATSGLSAKAVKPFEALGLDPKSFATTQDALDAVIAKIGDLGSAAEQAAVADKLGLTPLLPALREGTAAIDDMRQAAHDIGYVMDAELIEKAGDANDKYEALNAVLGVQFKSAMLEAVPALMQMTEMMVDAAKWAGDFAGKLNDVAAAYDRLSTHDFAGNDVGNDRNRLFGRMQQQQAVRQASSLSDWLNPKYDRVLPGQTLAAGNLSSVLDAPKEKPNELKDIREQNDRVAAARKAAGEAARAAAAAERARAAVLKAEADALHDAEQRSADYLAGLMEEVGTMGMSTEALKRRRSEMEAAAAPAEALANQIRAVEKQRRAQNQVSEEAAEKEKQVNDQLSETLTTLHDMVGLGPHFTTTLESMAMDLDKASDFARNLSYDVDDVARAINDNDWTTAFAGLAQMLLRVDTAFKTAKTSQDKFYAAAALAQGVGSAIGGTGGAAVSGAASGAMAGAQLGSIVPGIGTAAGAVVGGILGGLGGIFGSSKAKKQAKAQAAAQKAAEEAQRQQQIADIRLANSIALLRAQGKEQEAVNMERQAELAALERLDASLLADQQALYDLADAATAKALADQHAADVAAKTQDLQGRIDALTLSSSEQLAKKRLAERDAYVALDPVLGAMIDRLYGLEDAAAAAADATAMAAEAQRLADEATAKAQQLAQDSAARYAANVDSARQDLVAAYQREAAALSDTAERYRGFADTLRDYRQGLIASRGGADAMASLGGELRRLGLLMRVGNADSYGQFTGVADKFLASSADSAATLEEYLRTQDEVVRLSVEGEATARRQVDLANQQLAMLSEQVSGLVTVNDSVLSVGQAIERLRNALIGGGDGGVSGIGTGPGAFFNVDTANAFLAQSDAERQAFYDQWSADAAAWGASQGLVAGDVFAGLRAAPAPGGGLAANDAWAMSADQARTGNSEVVQALQAVESRLASIEGTSKATADASKDTRGFLARVTDGGNAMLTQAV